MQIIAVDIGNSAIKMRLAEEHLRLPYQSDTLPTDFSDVVAKHIASVDPSGAVVWAVVSVNDAISQQLGQWVKQNRSNDRFEIVKRDQVPLEVIDSYRKTVGIDRLVAAYAAVSLDDSKSPLIIVDAGTAVTVDVVSRNAVDGKRRFEGGLIFPGVAACLKALNLSTADLPDVDLSSASLEDLDSVEGLLGTETSMAIANGVRLAQAHAAAGIVSAFYRLPGAEVWITGGGAESILQLLEEDVIKSWISDPQLVLRGAAIIGEQILSNENAD